MALVNLHVAMERNSGNLNQPRKDMMTAKPKKKFDIKKVRCHNCGLFGHFKSDCRKPAQEKQAQEKAYIAIAQEGDEPADLMMIELCDSKKREIHL